MKPKILALLLAASAVLSGSRLSAQSGKNFYEGKVISYLVGSTAGGGNDITSSFLATKRDWIY